MDIGSWSPRMLSVLRAMTGLLFLEHGTQKLFGFPPPPNSGPALLSLLGVQGILELVGGFLILIGFFTRPVAFILAGDMALGYFMRHAPEISFPCSTGANWRFSSALCFFISSSPAAVFGALTSSEHADARADRPRKFRRACLPSGGAAVRSSPSSRARANPRSAIGAADLRVR